MKLSKGANLLNNLMFLGVLNEQARTQLQGGEKSRGGSFAWEFPKCATLA